MSEKTKKNQPESGDLPEQEPMADETDTEETELERVTRERDELRINWQRAAADYQNLKRRTIKDIENAVRSAQQGTLLDVLLVLDNLDMALATEVESEDAKNLKLGVQITRDQIIGVLEREQVLPIPVDGAFDPAVHQAVATIETTEVEPGQIVEAVRTGWTHGDLVLRYAQVKVAARPEEPDEA